ncbi:hypothetical protein GCM10009712_36740 [Pseudarthrobacter sulfonivorans]
MENLRNVSRPVPPDLSDAAQAEHAVDDVGADDHGGRCEGALVESVEAAPDLQPFRGPAVAGRAERSRFGEPVPDSWTG